MTLVNVAFVFVWLGRCAVETVALRNVRAHVIQTAIVCALIVIVAVLRIVDHQTLAGHALERARARRVIPQTFSALLIGFAWNVNR